MNEHESKARLIAKRIVADLADEGHPLGCEWMSLSEATRGNWAERWIEIASEVLGEEVEPPPPKQMLAQLCKQLGHEAVMREASMLWMVEEHGSRIVGPRREKTVPCDCDYDEHCEWCDGTGQVTKRVRQAMDESASPPIEPAEKTGDQFYVEDHWHEVIDGEGQVACFIDDMLARGATKIEMPASRNGTFSVEFGRGKPLVDDDPLAKIKQMVIAKHKEIKADDAKDELPISGKKI